MDFSRFPARQIGLQIAGFGATGLVWLAIGGSNSPPEHPLAVHLAMAVFAACLLLDETLPRFREVRIGLLVQAVAALVVIYLSRHSTAPILLIVVIAQAPFCLGVRGTVTLMGIVNAAMFMIIWMVWGANFTEALLSTLLYGTFQLFALLVGSFAISAEKARLELTEVNAELMATRSLLVESARDRERLRLSRELHDVAGHTLTALKLNLRTLARETDGDAQQLAGQSLELAENLLGDVRALVGNFRSNDGLAIDGAIQQLTAPFQSPRFEIEIDPDTRVEDLDVARTLIAVAREAITNVARHANAGVCRIAMDRTDQGLRMIVEDDGDGVKDAPPGQGLRGMKERMRALGGSLTVEAVASGGTRVIATVGGSA